MSEQSKIIGHVLKKASKLDYIVIGGRSVLIHIPFHILYVLQKVLPDYFVETEWTILVRKKLESEEDDDENKKKTDSSGTEGDYIKLCDMLTTALGVNVTITETDTPKKTIIKNHDTVLATISLDDGTFSKSMCIEPDRKHNGIKYASFCDTISGLKQSLQEHASIKTIFQLRVLLNGYNNDIVEEPSSALLKSLLDELNQDVRVKSDEINIKTTCKSDTKNSQTKPVSVGYSQPQIQRFQPPFQRFQAQYQQPPFQYPFQQPPFQQPPFQQPQAIFKPQESSYQPQESSYQPQESNYQPQESNYQPQESNYQPQESNYQPQGPNYQPTNVQGKKRKKSKNKKKVKKIKSKK